MTYGFQRNDRKEYEIIRSESSVAQHTSFSAHTGDVSFKHEPIALSTDMTLEGLSGVTGMLLKTYTEDGLYFPISGHSAVASLRLRLILTMNSKLASAMTTRPVMLTYPKRPTKALQGKTESTLRTAVLRRVHPLQSKL